MNTAGVRVYLDDEERAELDRFRGELGSSASYVMRLGLRKLVGLPTPALGGQRHDQREERTDGAATR